MDGECSTYGMTGEHSALVGETRGKESHGRPRRRWENINMDLQEMRWADMPSIYMAQNMVTWQELVYAVMNLWVP